MQLALLVSAQNISSGTVHAHQTTTLVRPDRRLRRSPCWPGLITQRGMPSKQLPTGSPITIGWGGMISRRADAQIIHFASPCRTHDCSSAKRSDVAGCDLLLGR
jgi:hypothetical protein